MAQMLPRACPRCGAEVAPQQHFCATCGLSMPIAQSNQEPTAQPSTWQAPVSAPAQPSVWHPASFPARQSGPAEAPQSLISQLETQPQQVPPVQPAQTTPFAPSPASQQNRPHTQFMQPHHLPEARQPEPAATPKQRQKKSGVIRLALVLILVLLLGVIGAAGAMLLGFHVWNPVQPPITTTQVNTTFTYAGITMSVTKVQQAQSFVDDPVTSNDGMIRVYLQEQNKTAVSVNLLYKNIVHLVAPGGKTIAATYAAPNVVIAPGAAQTGSVDFAVPMSTKLDQLIVRIGSDSEAQLDIPLASRVDLTKYTPRTVTIGENLQYLGLDWTLVNATSQLSIDGQQASKGMHYVVLTLAVDNTLAQTAIPGSPYDYMRLMAGKATLTPASTTLPVSYPSGAKGTTGTVTFLVPQNVSALTLMLMSQPGDGFDQATADFQLQG